MRLCLLLVLCLLLGQSGAQYDLFILLEEFSDASGFLADGSRCDPLFWFTPRQKCDLRLMLCVEPLSGTATPDLNVCDHPLMNGAYIDLGNVTSNQNSIVFNGDGYIYGGWSNPLVIRVATGTFQGFQVKVKAYDYDYNSNQLNVVDQYVYQFSDGVQVAGSNAYSHPRPAAPEPTFLSLAWNVGSYVAPTGNPPTTAKPPGDCYDIHNTVADDGVYSITLPNNNQVQVFCDLTGGGWTVIQSRSDDSGIFNGSFTDYEGYFGSAATSYWLGLQNMNSLTNSQQYALRIEMCCGNSSKTETYDMFMVGNTASSYILTVSTSATGAAGDGLNDVAFSLKDNGAPFSTGDKWTSSTSVGYCDAYAGYGGWWFGSCQNNLNGYVYDQSNYLNYNQCQLKTGLSNGPGLSWINTALSNKARMKIIPKSQLSLFEDTELEQQSLVKFCSW